jgi:hypothetical protein
MALCSLASTLGAGSSSRTPGIRRRGSMFHPLDTGPFKLVALRPTDSIKAHRASRYSKAGAAPVRRPTPTTMTFLNGRDGETRKKDNIRKPVRRPFQAPRGSCADNEGDVSCCRTCAGRAVAAACAGGSLLIAAVLARPLPVPVIKRVTEPARRQNASKCHQQGSDKRCPQDHRVPVILSHVPSFCQTKW